MKKTLIFLCVGLVFGASLAAAQETLSGVQRELDRVDREIEREKKLHQLEKQKAADFDAKKKEKRQALETQSAALDQQLDQLNKELNQLNGQKAHFKNQISSFERKRAETGQYLLKKIGELKSFFEKDFIYQREKRIGDLARLEQDLRDGVIGPEEGLNRFYTQLRSALALGYDTEIYSGTYESTDGKSVDGKYLRLGAAVMAFVSMDGGVTAYLTRQDSAYVWVDSGLDAELRQNIAKALKVAEGKSAPELVLLPFGNLKLEPEGE